MPTMGKRPVCQCGKPCKSKGRNQYGRRLWGRKCHTCALGTYTRFKKDYCEFCEFVAIHRVQLDVDHIDGDHTNNDQSNLQTLCANCHRLKTQLNNDHQPNRIDVVIIVNNRQLELGFEDEIA